jgi:hypothetical protein
MRNMLVRHRAARFWAVARSCGIVPHRPGVGQMVVCYTTSYLYLWLAHTGSGVLHRLQRERETRTTLHN